MVETLLTNREILFTDNGLAMVHEALDDLHNAASEGEIELVTTLDNRELVNWLRELVFTAQETIVEIEKRSAYRQEPYLRLVK
jgi:hypothetical protein